VPKYTLVRVHYSLDIPSPLGQPPRAKRLRNKKEMNTIEQEAKSMLLGQTPRVKDFLKNEE